MKMDKRNKVERQFVCFYHFIGFWHWSLGIHFWGLGPNLEIHLLFGFVRIGWEAYYLPMKFPKTFGWADGKFLNFESICENGEEQ